MTLRHFRIFVAVCDTMNMTLAAGSLYISQSAVSQAISELEGHYGIRLFERLSRKLFLTRAGEKLLGYARHIIRMSRDIENEMKTLSENGSIRVGASVTVGAYVLPGLVLAHQAIKPDIPVEVIEDNTKTIEEMLLLDKIDLALVEGETTSQEIVCEPFMEDELVLICSPAHRFAGARDIDPKELLGERFIVREKGSGTRKTFEDAMAANGLSWSEFWTCNNADTIKTAVEAGIGVSVLSCRAIQKESRSGSLCAVSIHGIQFRRRFKIIYHKNKYLTGHLRDFISLCFNGSNTIDCPPATPPCPAKS